MDALNQQFSPASVRLWVPTLTSNRGCLRDDAEPIIYVAMLDEGVDVWRPVRARHVSRDVFLIVDQPYDSEIETWQFAPGTEVICELRELSEGVFLVAVSQHP